DLLGEEEADHLALAGGLDLLAGDDGEVTTACQVDRLLRAAEDVVVGDGDRAEAFELGVVEELGDLDAAVVRPARVGVEVAENPVAVAEWVGVAPRAASAREPSVED